MNERLPLAWCRPSRAFPGLAVFPSLALGALVACVALAGCSGAAAQLVEAPRDDGGATTSSSGSPGSTPGTPGAGGGSASPGQGSGSGRGNGLGTGPGTGPGSGGFDAGVAPTHCPSGGTRQSSSSGDSQSNPTPFDTVACGTLAPDQSYFWTFELSGSTSTFGIAFTGGIRIQLTLNGNTMDVVPGATLPFRTREPYFLQITPLGTATESYVLVVTEK